MFFLLCFFFFKQKTAYEMRISDWSSDVCSSDLLLLFARQALDRGILRDKSLQYGSGRQPLSRDRLYRRSGRRRARDHQLQTTPHVWRARSEEHTSELQSLMRIPYAVFCLKKKQTHQHLTPHPSLTNSTANIT